MSFGTHFCIGAFVLILFGALMACGTRFLTDLNSATLELGIGPNVFLLDLNRFRYRINLLPFLFFQTQVESPIRRSQSAAINLFTVIGLLLVGLIFIGASLFLASRVFDRVPENPHSAREAAGSASFLVVKEVVRGSPAQEAGLAEGMVITGANGRTLETGSDLLLEYYRAKDLVKLNVLSNTAEPKPTIISIQKAKKAVPLGLVYAMLPQPTKPVGRFAKVYQVTKAALYEAARAWWAIPSLNFESATIPAFDHSYWNPAIFAMIAGLALSMMLYPLIYIFVGNYERFSWLVFSLCLVRPGFWIQAIVVGISLIIVWKSKPAWLGFAALFWFMFFHFTPIFTGINVGIIKQIAQLERLELLWTA